MSEVVLRCLSVWVITLCCSPFLFQYLSSCQRRFEADNCAWNDILPFGKNHHTLTTFIHWGREDKRRGWKKSLKWNLGFQQTAFRSYCLPENLMPWVFTTGCYHLITVTSLKPTEFAGNIMTSFLYLTLLLPLSFWVLDNSQNWEFCQNAVKNRY